MSRLPIRRGRVSALALTGLLAVLLAGCVNYQVHIQVRPDGSLDVTEKAEAQPGVSEAMGVRDSLAWTSFRALTEGRGGKFAHDGLTSATSHYLLDDWTDFGQRGPAFKGLDDIERRTKPASVQSEVKDQYFFRDVSLQYKVELSEPSGVTVDSVAASYLPAAKGELTVDVPGQVLKTNAPQRRGSTLVWPFAYSGTLDMQVTYRRFEWTSVVSTILVAIFLGYLGRGAIGRARSKKAKAKAA